MTDMEQEAEIERLQRACSNYELRLMDRDLKIGALREALHDVVDWAYDDTETTAQITLREIYKRAKKALFHE